MPSALENWISDIAALTQPEEVYWCTGSDEEAHKLVEIGLNEEKINGRPVFHELNQGVWPNSYLHLSDPSDVARTEALTFICHSNKNTTGPNNNWMDPVEAKKKMTELSRGCMRGRTMYVIPFVMGRIDSPLAKFCVQVTDSSYVAASMRIMTHVGSDVLKGIKVAPTLRRRSNSLASLRLGLGEKTDFIKGIHSVADLNPSRRFVMHFPEENLVWSVGSGYGGNALLGKKCIALRLASWIGFNEGWLAEHMIIIGVEDPKGTITYMAAAFPSACGKTNLAMLRSSLPGYKVWTVGDDIAWLHIGEDGCLYAMNPEAGFFGVAPGTSEKTNPIMIETLKTGTFFPTIFTNTGLDTDTNEPWWEGLTKAPPQNLLDWQGNKFTGDGKPAAHPNSRFTVAISQCPTLSPEYENPSGVKISAIIFGGRRSTEIPLVYESFNWDHGVELGANMQSETTAAAEHQIGVLRKDPMAMLPFCGYNMDDYFNHWRKIGAKLKSPPKIFFVNWFRKDENGKFLWPGFGENIRVLKWMIGRTQNKITAKETRIGLMPHLKDLDLSGLDLPAGNLEKLFNLR